ncbi:MAG: hypothetical protein AAF938_21130 [Myxococcota bacterium]
MGTDGKPKKEDIARALMLRGNLFVHLDPRGDSVLLPDHLKKQPQVLLQVGLDMPVPIPDLRVDDEGISGTLSFNRTPFGCAVPWDSVFALGGDDGRGMVWPESMPPEVEAEVDREAGRKPPLGLRVVEGGDAAVSSSAEGVSSAARAEPSDAAEPAVASRRRGHLRLVHNAD